MRLTSELITNSLSYLNPLKERELDLRGHRIPAIENLGVAGPHDAIDFTDNDIQVLGNFPLYPRIQTLLLAHNRIASIHPTLPHSIPNLTNLGLSNNNFTELADLNPLSGFHYLTHLVLADNPVAKKDNYRYWAVWQCPTVRFLDYQKVKDVERQRAKELFGTKEEMTGLAKKIMGIKSKTIDATLGGASSGTAGATSKMARLNLTGEERQKLQEMIKKAGSLQEIIRLEKLLNEGRLPAGFHGEAMEE
ncbi:U2 small nuclear ribonucleoprotein A [Zalerion maritima]|uniref:U2 small nuclear ribonucleoprotein A' n=1 Tax=Zalerion maritima TaxID=339359 RepID=A0AAD5RWX7_9PEZI|nr:U2 small nuclear ribonucleoprotein A [Zalerion maritima]